jgi:cell division protein FtsB
MTDLYPKPRWDLENDVLRLEQMIIVYEQEIRQLNIEKKKLKKEIKFLKTQLDHLSLGNPIQDETK